MKRICSEPNPSLFERAFDAWRQIVGDVWATRDPGDLALANQATFAAPASLIAAIHPADRAELAACLEVARRFGIALHPVSTGRNWGYGSRLAPATGSVLLRLGRLDRITAYDEDMGFVAVEPGVTFAALADFLRERGSTLLPPVIGGSPGASILANALSRGIGKGPYFSMAGRCCGLEVMLPDGEILRTGFTEEPLRRLARDAPGPSLDGLFLQSNLGVVTEAGFWLEPSPAMQEMIPLTLRQDEDLALLLDRLRRLLQRHDHRLQIELVNDYRIAMMVGRPAAAAAEPIPREALAGAMKDLAGTAWLCAATLWADSEAEMAWRREEILGAFMPWREAVGQPVRDPVGAFAPGLGGLAGMYWRKAGAMPANPDPDRDRCGLLWIAPVLPMNREGTAILATLQAIIAAHGFEPAVSLRLEGGRAMFGILSLVYDRDQPGADDRAALCHGALASAMRGLGVTPYRHGLLDAMTDRDRPALLHRLKRQLDPNSILSPGLYGL